MISEIIKSNFSENTNFVQEKFETHWRPDYDIDRKKHYSLKDFLIKSFENKRCLEIGFPFSGKQIMGSKILDLYSDNPIVDYKTDLCDAKIVPDNSFDLIFCISVLEHIPKIWKAAEELQRILDYNGILFCAIPALWPYHPTFGCKNEHIGGDYWRPTHEGLVSLFDKLEKLTVFYVPSSGIGEEHLSFGWCLDYVGTKRR